MNTKLVFDLTPIPENARNSEGAFLRSPDGSILFAYSRYSGPRWDDDDACDIAMIRSTDEGETWSEPEIIAPAKAFGTSNVMSVSGILQQDGSLGFYFLIKEPDGTNTIGRAVSPDGIHFTAMRCRCRFLQAYYGFANDAMIRLSDGRLVIPAALSTISSDPNDPKKNLWDFYSSIVCLVSDDDGESFTKASPHVFLSAHANQDWGLQEPGILERKNGVVQMWIRTRLGRAYECFSLDGLRSFTTPEPSEFTSPDSPMRIARATDNTLYAVYNSAPNYNGRILAGVSWGRSPLTIRKSTDDGISWGICNTLEEDNDRGLCYPAVFFTNDNAMLCAYCRGGTEDFGCCLTRLGIRKIPLNEIQ